MKDSWIINGLINMNYITSFPCSANISLIFFTKEFTAIGIGFPTSFEGKHNALICKEPHLWFSSSYYPLIASYESR